ncbi:DoxX family protein [Candidatus Peribacteria bacterium]|nr:DoxX family protein [Candidatus Peribacteria bacterium]
MKAFFATKNDLGTMLLRVGAGLAMLPFGIQKVQTFEGTMQFFTGMGIPYFIAVLVVVAETLGAVALVLGFCSRFCAALLAVIMVGAVYAMFSSGYFAGYATPLLFLIMFVPLVVNGAGAWSVDAEISKKMA